MMKEEMTMKKMISSMKTLVALLMVGATVTSCSSDDTIADQPVQQPAGPQVYTMTVEATKGGDETRALNLDGNKLNATWTAGDEVEVWTEDGTTTKYGELTAESDGASTKLTGTLTTKPSDGETLTLKYLSPNYSSQDGTLTGTDNSIDKVCDYATATVTATVDGDNVTTTAAAFENQQAVVKFTLKNKANDSDLSATKLVVAVGSTEYEVNPESAASEIYVAIPGFNGQTITLTATVGSDTYTYEKTGVTFANGNYYRVAVKMTKQAAVPTGAISGKFSVSATKQVYFSKGNLRYTSGAWSFFDNQWDYYTEYSADSWDKFGWSTSATDYGKNTSSNTLGYPGDFVDWGATIGTGWRTLTGGIGGEWEYLFNTRTVNGGSGSGKSYTLGQSVNGKLGVVIYPDDYTGSEYAGSDWSTFEAAGCVFLPAAGYRNGTSVDLAGSYGLYWSSSPGELGAYEVDFNSDNLNANWNTRNYGNSVRLVRPVQP